MSARRITTIDEDRMTSDDDVVGINNNYDDEPGPRPSPLGAGIPDDWVPIRDFGARFGHGHTQSAARNWFLRQVRNGLVREWFDYERTRYVSEGEIERYRHRLVERTRRTVDELEAELRADPSDPTA